MVRRRNRRGPSSHLRSRRRRRRGRGGNNHERWLVSYADFITLLFAFFTSLYAISTVDAKKASRMVYSTRAAFSADFFPNGPPEGPLDSSLRPTNTADKVDQLDNQYAQAAIPAPPVFGKEELKQLIAELKAFTDQPAIGNNVRVRIEDSKLYVSLSSGGFFTSSLDADLRERALPVLAILADKLVASGMPITVEGHSDNQVLQGAGAYANNWDLSASRAAAVLSYLVEEFAFPADRLQLRAYGGTRPTGDNQTAAGRKENRRVEMVLDFSKVDRSKTD